MKFKWHPKSKPSPVVAAIYESIEVGDGSIGTTGMQADEDIAILASMLTTTQGRTDLDKVRLIWDAIASTKAPSDDSALLEAINAQAAAHRRKRREKFTFISSLSVARGWAPASVKVDDLTVRFFKNGLPRRYASRIDVTRDAIKWGHISPNPESYCYIAINVEARNHTEAFELATRELDLLRGAFCWLANPQVERILLGPEYKPVNVVRSGSFHTLHEASGKVATSTLMYEPNHSPANLYSHSDPKRFFRSLKIILTKLREKAYSGRLADALIRFTKALDEADADMAFVKGWSALESLLSSTRADYPALVRRCTFLYADRPYHEAVISQLVEHRNSSVHRVSDGTLSRLFCYRLQGFFRVALKFHLANQKHFQGFDEAMHFLDGPHTREELDRRMALAMLARSFLDNPAKPPTG